MTYSSVVLADAPAGYYRLGESALPFVNSGSAGTFANLAQGPYGSSGTVLFAQPPVIGEAGDGAVQFPGRRYIQTANNALASMSSFTVEFWIKSTNAWFQALVSRNPSSGTKLWAVRTSGSGAVMYSDLYWNRDIGGNKNVCDGSAHHVAVTVAGTSINIYVDGVLDVSGTTTSGLPFSSPPLYIGGDENGYEGLVGTLDELAIYSKVLTTTRIAAHYNAGKPVGPANVARTGTPMALAVAAPAGAKATWPYVTHQGQPQPLQVTVNHATTTKYNAPRGIGKTMALVIDEPPGGPRYPKPAQLELLDTTIARAPTAIVVRASGVAAGADVTFQIDGVDALPVQADAAGTVSPISLAVDDTHMAGDHTVTLNAGDFTQTETFTLRADPPAIPWVRGPDLAPVLITEALLPTGVRKWVFQDLMPGGLGSYVLPISPATLDGPMVSRTYATHRATAPGGSHHLYEGGPAPLTWTLRGYCRDKAMHDQLQAYGELNRRFYVIDHRNRAWTVVFAGVAITPRKRQLEDDVFNDWAGDYEISALVYDENWKAPQ